MISRNRLNRLERKIQRIFPEDYMSDEMQIKMFGRLVDQIPVEELKEMLNSLKDVQ